MDTYYANAVMKHQDRYVLKIDGVYQMCYKPYCEICDSEDVSVFQIFYTYKDPDVECGWSQSGLNICENCLKGRVN